MLILSSSQTLVFGFDFRDFAFVLYEHNRCRLVENEVKFSECFAATYGDVKQCPYKVSKRRSRRTSDVLFRAGSLGLMNGVGIRSPQRQAIAKII